jgi:hypothetical protein
MGLFLEMAIPALQSILKDELARLVPQLQPNSSPVVFKAERALSGAGGPGGSSVESLPEDATPFNCNRACRNKEEAAFLEELLNTQTSLFEPDVRYQYLKPILKNYGRTARASCLA